MVGDSRQAFRRGRQAFPVRDAIEIITYHLNADGVEVEPLAA